MLTNRCNIVSTCVCRHVECLQMYAMSAPFELLLNFTLAKWTASAKHKLCNYIPLFFKYETEICTIATFDEM